MFEIPTSTAPDILQNASELFGDFAPVVIVIVALGILATIVELFIGAFSNREMTKKDYADVGIDDDDYDDFDDDFI